MYSCEHHPHHFASASCEHRHFSRISGRNKCGFLSCMSVLRHPSLRSPAHGSCHPSRLSPAHDSCSTNRRSPAHGSHHPSLRSPFPSFCHPSRLSPAHDSYGPSRLPPARDSCSTSRLSPAHDSCEPCLLPVCSGFHIPDFHPAVSALRKPGHPALPDFCVHSALPDISGGPQYSRHRFDTFHFCGSAFLPVAPSAFRVPFYQYYQVPSPEKPPAPAESAPSHYCFYYSCKAT